MRRRPFARVNSCGFACAPEASAKARRAARAGTIATDAKIQLLFYSGSFSDSFFSPMLELSSKMAREEVSWATRLRSGSGKTTSIGKLARYFQDQGRSVLLAAGDTFRAAAREQLAAWGEKNAVAVVAQSGGDPGAVVFDAIAAARSREIDVVIADTAGRLPTQLHLMEEIRRIKIGRAHVCTP